MNAVLQSALASPRGAWLAPMAGVSDVVFRGLCFEQGCVMAVSEMISAKGYLLAPADLPAHRRLLAARPGEAVGVQIFGSDPQLMAEAARRLAALQRFLFIDINMGCPMPKITSHGEGSALMKDRDLAARIVTSVARAVGLPVTVKMRCGWEENTAVDFARALQDAGASALAVHGRTRAQGYSGAADWAAIAEVKRAVSIPVIGNGDVTSGTDAVAMLRETGCDAVMVGRGAQGNPFIFAEIAAALQGAGYAPPTDRQRLEHILRHALLLAEEIGPHAAAREMRKHVGWAVKGMRGASALREAAQRAPSLEALVELLEAARDEGDAPGSAQTRLRGIAP